MAVKQTDVKLLIEAYVLGLEQGMHIYRQMAIQHLNGHIPGCRFSQSLDRITRSFVREYRSLAKARLERL